MTHNFKIGDRVLVRGIVRSIGQVCCEIKTASSPAPVVHYNEDVEIDPAPAPPASGGEVERVARIMCQASYGDGMADKLVNMWQMPIVGHLGAVGHRFIMPPLSEQMPLWREFYAAAQAVIEDRAK